MAPKQTKTETEKVAPIIIKKIKKGGGGHHGGAWKVAYADFVTAMMAFFLLLWLLNVTTEVQKNAISNYFDPSHPQVSSSESGAGGVMGGLSMSVDGAMVSNVQPITQPQVPQTTTRGAMQGEELPSEIQDMDPDEVTKMTQDQLEKALDKIDEKRFKDAEKQIREEIAKSPELKELQNNLLIDITPEGLRIQIVDDQGRSMFQSGSITMEEFMRGLLTKVTGVIKGLPNQVSIRGHTDAKQYRAGATYDNWNLSSDRALASRRVLVGGGLVEKRVENVVGRADREPLLPQEPMNPRNRRISIIMLRERLTKPVTPQATKEAVIKAKAEAKAPAPAGTLTPTTGTAATPATTPAGTMAPGTGNAATSPAATPAGTLPAATGTGAVPPGNRLAIEGAEPAPKPAISIVDDTPGRRITAPNWTRSQRDAAAGGLATGAAATGGEAAAPAADTPASQGGGSQQVLEFE